MQTILARQRYIVTYVAGIFIIKYTKPFMSSWFYFLRDLISHSETKYLFINFLYIISLIKND